MAPALATRVVLATAGIVAVGALTPGPNNLIVLDHAARRGFARALPAVIAITCGSVALILVVAGGAGAVLSGSHWLHFAATVAGCAYLCWLGMGLLVRSSGVAARPPGLESERPWNLFAFQLVNPKGWAMALTASTALEDCRSLGAALTDLAALFAIIPAACLLLWCAAGASLTRQLERPRTRLAFDRSMGALLLASAIALVF